METQIKFSDLYRQRKYLKPRLSSLAKYGTIRIRNRKKKISSLPLILEDNARISPNKLALIYQDQQLTYYELNAYANKVAHCLSDKGIHCGDVVALHMENRIEYLVYLAGIVKQGAIAALINNTQRGQSLKHSIDLVKPKAVIVGEEVCGNYEEVTDFENNDNRLVFYVPDTKDWQEVTGERSGYINASNACKDYPTENQNVEVDAEDATMFIYTSGTTGMPKATVQTHARFAKILPLSMLVNPLDKDDKLYCTLPLYHGTALLCWMSVMGSNATFILKRKFSATEFWEDIDKHKATSFGYIGELCRYLLNTPSPKSESNTLRSMVGNGLRPDLWMQFKEKFQIEEVREIFTASESNLGSFNLFNVDKTVGMLVGGYAIVKYDEESQELIRDSKDRLQRVHPGEGGIMLGKVSKLLPFTGYTDKSKNESKLVRNAFSEGDLWFNTGDVVRDVGCRHIQFLDRSGDTYRWKGENVSTSEVEKIINQFPGVQESVVYGVEVPHTTGRAGMVAIKLADNTPVIHGDEFYSYLSSQLPGYAIPLFYRVNETLERTATFKYKKQYLKQDSYELNKIKSGVWIAMHSEKSYISLDSAMVNDIKENRMKI